MNKKGIESKRLKNYREGQISNVQRFLQLYKVLDETQNFEEFLSGNYIKIQSKIDEYCCKQKSNGAIVNLVWLVTLADALHTTTEQTKKSVVVSNADRLKDLIGLKIVDELNPQMRNILTWDFERRTWKNKENKIAFLNATIETIKAEINGEKDNLIEKYIGILLDFCLYHFDKIINDLKDIDFQGRGFDRESVHDTCNKLKEISNKTMLKDAIDDEMKSGFLNMYKPIAQSFLEGLFKSSKRYDYIITAFITAQDDFRNYMEGLLGSITSNNISNLKASLQNENVDEFIDIIHTVFAGIPYHLSKKSGENYYHSIIHSMMYVTGCNVKSEEAVNNGRIDSVVEFDNLTYIIEYKTSDSTSAIKQIKERRYYEKYSGNNKKIVMLGISFSLSERNINREYEKEYYNNGQ
ncbi:hypothetical protein CNR22_20410 [Sphingobacteriaceae bacterium]|nr:hypothetical protein CNR22_20410 [Sphingobacteriaceae bacterium]